MPRYNGWVEPRNYGDIKHIAGCISTRGCRCAAYENLNPREGLPADLRAEVDALNSEFEDNSDNAGG